MVTEKPIEPHLFFRQFSEPSEENINILFGWRRKKKERWKLLEPIGAEERSIASSFGKNGMAPDWTWMHMRFSGSASAQNVARPGQFSNKRLKPSFIPSLKKKTSFLFHPFSLSRGSINSKKKILSQKHTICHLLPISMADEIQTLGFQFGHQTHPVKDQNAWLTVLDGACNVKAKTSLASIQEGGGKNYDEIDGKHNSCNRSRGGNKKWSPGRNKGKLLKYREAKASTCLAPSSQCTATNPPLIV